VFSLWTRVGTVTADLFVPKFFARTHTLNHHDFFSTEDVARVVTLLYAVGSGAGAPIHPRRRACKQCGLTSAPCVRSHVGAEREGLCVCVCISVRLGMHNTHSHAYDTCHVSHVKCEHAGRTAFTNAC
jgi:hypothetical protein